MVEYKGSGVFWFYIDDESIEVEYSFEHEEFLTEDDEFPASLYAEAWSIPAFQDDEKTVSRRVRHAMRAAFGNFEFAADDPELYEV